MKTIKFEAWLSRKFEDLVMELQRSFPEEPGTLAQQVFVWGAPDPDGMLSANCSGDLITFLRKEGFDLR